MCRKQNLKRKTKRQSHVDSAAGGGVVAAREYLVGRGFDGASAEKYGIGFAPDSWDGLKDTLRREKKARRPQPPA